MTPRPPSSRRIPYEDDSSAAVRAMRNHLALGESEAAHGVYQKAREKIAGWAPPTPEWVELIKGLIDQEAWDTAIAVMLSLELICGLSHGRREAEQPEGHPRASAH